MPKAENKRKDRENFPNECRIDLHNYASKTATTEHHMEEDAFALPALPDTPQKSPLTKKGKKSDDDDPDGIVSKLSCLINTRADSIEKMVGENLMKIEGLKKTIDFISEEIRDVKSKVKEVDTKVKLQEQQVQSCECRIAELERYSRRWNLRLMGVPENNEENVKMKVINICQKTLMNDNMRVAEGIDIVHRLGRKDPNKTTPRNIIIQFSSRTLRDALWKSAKKSTYLKDNNMRFAEDLTAADREQRRLLWPLVKDARAQGKTAYFIAGRAFANGAEMFLPSAS